MITTPRKPDRSTEKPENRRGAIVVLVAFMIVAFLVSVAFSVDVSYMQLTRTKLLGNRRGGPRRRRGTFSAQDEDYARQQAKDIAAANKVAGKPLLLEDEDIVFGRSTQQGGGAWAFTAGAEPINAVRVFGRRTGEAPSGSVPLFFGRVLNVRDFEPTQAATVVRLDRDICLVVDRSSSMKLHLTDTSPTMSTSDTRFCKPPNMSLSRWVRYQSQCSASSARWEKHRSPSTWHWFPTAAITLRAA